MQLEFRQFQREYYPEYALWFADPELNRRLGPMDQEWIDSILSTPESELIVWAIFHEAQFVSVIETVFDPERLLPVAISAIAVKPTLRGEGIGTAVLTQILDLHHRQGYNEHLAYIAVDNKTAQHCLKKIGFTLATNQPDEHGYLEFRHSKRSA